MTGHLFIVSAPSGTGKTTLVRALLAAEPTVRLSVSYTTRAPRPDEVDGRDYHFVSAPTFERMLENGEFLESATVHGNRYGTSEQWIAGQRAQGDDILLEIDWQGARQVRQLAPDAVGIFILPPSMATLAERLVRRAQDSRKVIERRLAAAREEIGHVAEFDYAIINDDFNRASQDLISIVRAQRLRLSNQLARHADLINELK